MTVSLLDLSDRHDLADLSDVIGAVQACSSVELLLVGATARDLLLLHAHGINTLRATDDFDLAFAVADWDAYDGARRTLLASGDFVADTAVQHRLAFRGQQTVAAAIPVRLPRGAEVRVTSLPALALLKLMAWKDRRYTAPEKDASDLWLLLRSYAEAGNLERLYNEFATILQACEFDLERAGARLLGADARRVLQEGDTANPALATVCAILDPEIDADGPLRLLGQMPPSARERQLSLLTAFHAGLTGEGHAP